MIAEAGHYALVLALALALIQAVVPLWGARTRDSVLIPGFVIAGSGNKRLLIRAVGPTLTKFGINEPLPDPRLVLKRWNGASYDDIATNDDWGTNANADAIRTTAAELFAFSLNDGSPSSPCHQFIPKLPVSGAVSTERANSAA